MIDAVLLTKDDFNKMTELLKELNQKIDAMIPPNINTMMDNQQFIKYMNISKRTAQSWRDEGKISFMQIGNKIYYRFADIEHLLDDHKIDAFKTTRKKKV